MLISFDSWFRVIFTIISSSTEKDITCAWFSWRSDYDFYNINWTFSFSCRELASLILENWYAFFISDANNPILLAPSVLTLVLLFGCDGVLEFWNAGICMRIGQGAMRKGKRFWIWRTDDRGKMTSVKKVSGFGWQKLSPPLAAGGLQTDPIWNYH